MKKLSLREVEHAAKSSRLILGEKVHMNFAKADHTFEITGHDRVTIDITSNFIQAAASYKASRAQGNSDVRIFRTNNVTGRKTQEWINPLY